MNSRIRLYAYVFLVLSIQFVVPASLWHGLCHHEDTAHCSSALDGQRIEAQHQHCLVLELSLPSMHYSGAVPVHAYSTSSFIFPDSRLADIPFLPSCLLPNRGPPSSFS